jgi:hypothetical protein
MAAPLRYRDSKTHSTPRWVKVFGIIALIVVLLVFLLLVTRGPHRPGRHLNGGGTPGVHIPSGGA